MSLREHLERRHERPHQCHRCWIIFPCEQSLLEHIQTDPICERIDLKGSKGHEAEGLTGTQRKAIRTKSHFVNAQTLEEQWNVVWRILFPNDFPIPSPCKSTRILERNILTVSETLYTLDLSIPRPSSRQSRLD